MSLFTKFFVILTISIFAFGCSSEDDSTLSKSSSKVTVFISSDGYKIGEQRLADLEDYLKINLNIKGKRVIVFAHEGVSDARIKSAVAAFKHAGAGKVIQISATEE